MLWRGDFVFVEEGRKRQKGQQGRKEQKGNFGGDFSLPQTNGEDAEEADDNAENRHWAVAFAETDGRI